ncbi:MAG TPA: helix-turn-helix transcriptional regulator [Steroidobacteraceae bacterium]|jgi:transcriptional regulator with XRE-family HTH domain|nr:helix-turn-helix transcriptional regulator [Steroidobacteraceae bacterium]
MTQSPGNATGNESSRKALAIQTIRDTGSATTTLPCNDADAQRRRELALFLKAKRAAIAPQKVGLHPGRRRRTNGLLREEVAQRAGISPTWYTWLEQGREINASTEVLEHLADALLLTRSERAHVMTLARPGTPSRGSMRFSHEVSAVLRSWIDGLDQAAYVLNGRWDVLAWNAAAVQLLGDFAALSTADRNILRMIFLWPHWRRLFVDWECLAESVVAQFRAETARHSGAPELLELTDALAGDSAEFARLWHARAVDVPQLKVKRLQHPGLGTVELTYAPLRPGGVADDLSVVVYSARAD